MTTPPSPGPRLARRAAGGAELAQFFDPELVADQFRRITLHLAETLFEDGGTGTGAGLATEGAHGATLLRRVQGRLLAELVELVHRLGAARLRGAGGWRHAGLRGRAFTGASAPWGTIQLTRTLLPFPLLLLLGLALGGLVGFGGLALTGFGLRLGLTLAPILGLTLPLPAGGGLILGLFPLLGLGLLLLLAATGLRGPLRGRLACLTFAGLILLGLFRLRALTVLALLLRLVLLGPGGRGLLLVRLATLGVLLGRGLALLALLGLGLAGTAPLPLLGLGPGGRLLPLFALARLGFLTLLAGLTL